MNKILIILFLVIICFSCSMQTVNNNWYDFDKKLIPEDLKYSSNIDLKKSIQIYNYVNSNINYKLYANGFHPVEITLKEKEGNCANRALTNLALIYKIQNNIKGKLVYCYAKNQYKEGLHYAIMIDNTILDNSTIIEIYEIIDFDDIAEYIYWRQ